MQLFLYLSYIIVSFSFYIPARVEIMKTQQKHKIKKKTHETQRNIFQTLYVLNFLRTKSENLSIKQLDVLDLYTLNFVNVFMSHEWISSLSQELWILVSILLLIREEH